MNQLPNPCKATNERHFALELLADYNATKESDVYVVKMSLWKVGMAIKPNERLIVIYKCCAEAHQQGIIASCQNSYNTRSSISEIVKMLSLPDVKREMK